MFFIDAEYETLPSVCKLIFDGYIQQAILFVKNGKDLNKSDENGNAALHYSVMCNSEELLECLLKQNSIQIDLKNHDDETAFLMSIKMRRSDSFIQKFIEAGCDVDTQNDVQEIALHLAISYSLNDTVFNMLEKGANVNIRDGCNQTALHAAVESRNLEGGCMLLCYGADVSYTEHANMTAFMFALNDYFEPFANILFLYQSNFSDVSIFGDTPLLIATKVRSNLAFSIVEAGAELDCLSTDGMSPLLHSLQYTDSALFNLIWSKVNYRELTNTTVPLLSEVVCHCSFSNTQWLECLDLLLESPLVTDLVTHVTLSKSGSIFLSRLLIALRKRNIDIKTMIEIIYSFLSFGMMDTIKIPYLFNYYLH